MIVDNFKRKNVKKKNDKFLGKVKPKMVVSDCKINSILILANDYDENCNFQSLGKELNVEESNIHIILFKEKVDKKSSVKNEVSGKDFSLLGSLKNNEVKKLLKEPIDLLVNYVQGNNYVNNLVIESSAQFKIGIDSQSNPMYNLMIDLKSLNFEDYHREIKKYLKILNKIE